MYVGLLQIYSIITTASNHRSDEYDCKLSLDLHNLPQNIYHTKKNKDYKFVVQHVIGGLSLFVGVRRTGRHIIGY